MIVVHFPHDSALDGTGDVLDVHEVAVRATVTTSLVEGAASRLTEVRDRGVLGLDQLSAVEAACELHQCTLCVFLVIVLHVHVTNHVVAQVVHHDQILNLTVVCELKENLDVEGLQVLLSTVIHVVVPRLVVRQGQRLRGVGVHVRQEERLTHGWPVVQTIALVAIPAGADLEVERAIHSVFLCAEDTGQLLSHGVRSRPGPTLQGSFRRQPKPT
mmetsp:Transcript_44919/g.128878  ORF Transcript_44919/g.128878 Transcript_44919/m.128878 type:complete len:215 (+) Transcript_44919:486-1130(+)